MCLVRVDNNRIRELECRERTADEWIHMAEQAAKAGTLGLLLTGGEVTLRPDFCEIYEAVAQMGFLLTVYTNATMITDKVMDVFRKYPPHKIGVTMYGASNDTYKRLCGCENGYDRVYDHDVIGMISTLINMGDYENVKEYMVHILDNVQYPDARWKYSWPFALYLLKSGDVEYILEMFDTIKENTHYIVTLRTGDG